MIAKAKHLLDSCLESGGHIVVLTGAGISAESGVPTFRGEQGLWRNYRPEELATPQAFFRDPKTVWEWYNWRRSLIAECVPNAAHHALVALEKRAAKFTLLTQNVDGLHALAGSQNVYEVHGSIWKVRCTNCGSEVVDRAQPHSTVCAGCGGLTRPGVVWFGEALDEAVLGAAFEALSSCDLMLVIGTSALVQPSASFADIALARGASVININLEENPLVRPGILSLLGKAGELLPRLLG